MSQLPVGPLERAKSEFVARRAMRTQLADDNRDDGDVKDIETVPARQQWEEARIDELLTQARSGTIIRLA
jgi:hypothetical protein